MGERIIPSAPSDRGQSVGPSAEDIAFFKDHSRISPPLRTFPGRQALTPVAIVGTSVLVSGCVSTSPDNGPQQNSGEYCIIEFPPDQGFTNKDYLRFNVGFYEPSNPDSEHRVIIKNEFGSVVNPDNISKYSTSALINGVTLNKRLSNGDYTMEVREKAVDLIFGDEGKSCEVDLYLGTDGGPRDENGNPILPDEQIARAESMQEILSNFIAKYDGKPVEANDRSNLNQCTDLVTAFADELEISREAVTGIGIAKNLYLNPREATEDFFEMIKYEKGTKIQAGDVMVWDERVGSPAGHTAIATGEMRNGKFVTFSQNYPLVDDPKDATAHLQEIGDEGLIGILRPKGFGPREEAPRATEKPDPKKRIEAILAVEPGDSNKQIAEKMVLSKFFNALNSSQSSQTDNYGNTDRVLDVSVTNLEGWESNIARLLSGESVDNDPLKISFMSTYESGRYYVERRVGRGEIDNISFYIDERPRIVSDLDKKNGAQTWSQTWFIASISYFERSQALSYEGRIYDDKERKKFLDNKTISDNLPGITEWTEETIYFEVGPNAKVGEWHISVRYTSSGMRETLEYQGGWEGIDLVTRMFNFPSCNYQANYDSGWARYAGCVLKDIDDN